VDRRRVAPQRAADDAGVRLVVSTACDVFKKGNLTSVAPFFVTRLVQNPFGCPRSSEEVKMVMELVGLAAGWSGSDMVVTHVCGRASITRPSLVPGVNWISLSQPGDGTVTYTGGG
jgi:hypothetical protein